MKIRIGFSKTGNLKYIGHLDIMRCFQKIIRRAEIDICYSAGFSPHQIMSFASPLGLGLTSEGEYVDIEVNSTGSSEEMLKLLNSVTVDGIEFLSYVLLPEKTKPAMAVVSAADYRLTFDEVLPEEFVQSFNEFLDRKEIVVSRQTKKQVIEIDIRPLIYEASIDGACMFMKVAYSSAATLKPEQVLDAFFESYGLDPQAYRFHNHRLEMYTDVALEGEPNQFIPMSRMGEVIG